MPSFIDEPTMTVSLTTVGVEWRPISPVSRSIGLPSPNTTPTFRSTTPSLPKDGTGCAGLRVERDQAVARRDVEDAVVAAAVGPVGQRRGPTAAAAPPAPRGAFGIAVHPQQLAGRGVERHHRAARAAGRVEHAADHQRRAFELVFRARAEAVGLEAPGDFELVEVARVDLIERRVPGAAQIGRVVRPLAVLRWTAARRLARRADGRAEQGEDQEQERRARRRSPHESHSFRRRTAVRAARLYPRRSLHAPRRLPHFSGKSRPTRSVLSAICGLRLDVHLHERRGPAAQLAGAAFAGEVVGGDVQHVVARLAEARRRQWPCRGTGR